MKSILMLLIPLSGMPGCIASRAVPPHSTALQTSLQPASSQPAVTAVVFAACPDPGVAALKLPTLDTGFKNIHVDEFLATVDYAVKDRQMRLARLLFANPSLPSIIEDVRPIEVTNNRRIFRTDYYTNFELTTSVTLANKYVQSTCPANRGRQAHRLEGYPVLRATVTPHVIRMKPVPNPDKHALGPAWELDSTESLPSYVVQWAGKPGSLEWSEDSGCDVVPAGIEVDQWTEVDQMSTRYANSEAPHQTSSHNSPAW